MLRNSFIILLLGFLPFSCNNQDDPGINDNPPVLRELSDDEISLVTTSNEFVFDLLRQVDLRAEEANYFFSPLSVEYALAMTMNGADGETLEAVKDVLGHKNLEESAVNTSYQSLTGFLLGIDKTVTLKIANSVWFRETLTVNGDFRDAVENYYDAEVAGLNFGDPGAKDQINGWVENKTEGLIKDLIDVIPPEVVMYLINAIYFKAEWQYTFDKTLTRKGTFIQENGDMNETDMMTSDGTEVGYYNDNLLRFIDIPYGNGQYSMTILVPATDHTVNDISAVLDNQHFNQWAGSAITATSKLTMPKFRIEYKTLLNDHLTDMGMGIAFTGSADLSRLFDDPLGLMICRVIHQAVIEVNEEGSEAAAATAVEIVETSLPPEPDIIVINRPFLFLIREKHSGSILFAGKFAEPMLMR